MLSQASKENQEEVNLLKEKKAELSRKVTSYKAESYLSGYVPVAWKSKQAHKAAMPYMTGA